MYEYSLFMFDSLKVFYFHIRFCVHEFKVTNNNGKEIFEISALPIYLFGPLAADCPWIAGHLNQLENAIAYVDNWSTFDGRPELLNQEIYISNK